MAGEPIAPALTGGCACGAVRFEIARPLLGAVYCHCTRCRRRTGSAFSVSALTEPGSFRVVGGEGRVRSWRPPDGWEKSFCAECGGHTHTTHPDRPDLRSVRVGALDGDPGVRPSAHQFVAYAAPWFTIPDDGLPRFAERLPEGARPPR